MNSLLIKKKNELQKKKKGFTLVELIIVIAIIAVLIALAIPKFGTVIENSNQKADQAAAKNIATIVAQKVAEGTSETTGTVTGDSDDTLSVADALDGVKIPKAKAANGAESFTYEIDDATGNITVSYTDEGEVYPTYDPATP